MQVTMLVNLSHQLSSQFGITAKEIIGRELQSVCKRWLTKFCPNVKRNTGKWVHDGYWWHAYSFNHEQAISGLLATEEYQSQPLEPFFLFHESDDAMFDCTGRSWPDVRVFEDDIYILPHSLNWAFLTTHEMSAGLGPYFAIPPP